MPKKFCLIAGCPQMALTLRCPVHERAYQADRNAKPSRAEYATAEYRKARKAVVGLPCLYCGEAADTADHVVPVSHGGSWRNGLVPACRRCNSSRGNR